MIGMPILPSKYWFRIYYSLVRISLTRGVSFGVAEFSREAATAHSRGRQPTDQNQIKRVSREAAAADVIAVAASRLWLLSFFLRAYARSYVLPSLRDSKLCNFKTSASIVALISLTRRVGSRLRLTVRPHRFF